MKRMIPIVCSFDDRYTLPALVFLTSLFKNANSETFYKVYVLFSSYRLSDFNINKVKTIEENFIGNIIEFIDVKDVNIGVYESKHITIDAYNRLLIPELIPEKRVIYLDVDILVKSDLASLYELNIEDKMIAGVRDVLTLKQKRYQKKIGNEPSNYINSGVLLIDIEKIKEASYQSKYIEFIKYKFENHDQDIINKVYKDKIYFLDKSYNYTFQYAMLGVQCEHFHIIHYTIFKPWLYPCAFSDEWWNYYKESIAYSFDFYNLFQLKHYKNLNRHIRIGSFCEKIGLYKLLDVIKPN